MEKKYISYYKSNIHECGYNLNEGGDGNIGYIQSPETLQIRRDLWTEERKLEVRLTRSNRKTVSQYDLKLNLIATYNSIGEAANNLQGDATFKTKSNKISACCNGKEKSYKSYIWKFS